MHSVAFADGIDSVLAIGCHSDDIEIGCGGTIVALLERNPQLEITWVVLSAAGEREAEARASSTAFLAGAEREPRLILESFRDSFFPYVGAEIKEAFERLKQEVSPQLVLTHAGTDLHQDHRLVNELTWNTFRNHLILEFEIPKYDADLGTPNVFVPLDESLVRHKVALLLQHFGTQRSRHWFTEDLFLGLMRLRGIEANSPTGYAEAFRCRKLQLTP